MKLYYLTCTKRQCIEFSSYFGYRQPFRFGDVLGREVQEERRGSNETQKSPRLRVLEQYRKYEGDEPIGYPVILY